MCSGNLIPGSQRTFHSLAHQLSKTNMDKKNNRPEGRKTPHKYPIPMWQMVADIMTGLPDVTVRHVSSLTQPFHFPLPRHLGGISPADVVLLCTTAACPTLTWCCLEGEINRTLHCRLAPQGLVHCGCCLAYVCALVQQCSERNGDAVSMEVVVCRARCWTSGRHWRPTLSTAPGWTGASRLERICLSFRMSYQGTCDE
jgi:hypothetical protein